MFPHLYFQPHRGHSHLPYTIAVTAQHHFTSSHELLPPAVKSTQVEFYIFPLSISQTQVCLPCQFKYVPILFPVMYNSLFSMPNPCRRQSANLQTRHSLKRQVLTRCRTSDYQTTCLYMDGIIKMELKTNLKTKVLWQGVRDHT